MSGIKTGIMGGTFNPPHNGHMALAKAAKEQLLLDEILFIPSGQSYMKQTQEIVSKEDRLNMVRCAIGGQPDYFVSDMELKREGNTYTYETLEQLKKEYPEKSFYFILGADCLYTIEKWREPERIFASCTLVSAVRDHVTQQELTKQCAYLRKQYDAKVLLLNFKEINISSTDIRKEIFQGKKILEKVPKEVADYIASHRLYMA